MYSAFLDWETATRSSMRIFDPFSYRAAHFAGIVPICLGEAMNLCNRWPLLWQRTVGGDGELIALRGVNPAVAVPGADKLNRQALPLLLQAYPLRLREMTPGSDIGFDRVAPMRERDGGAYVLDATGEVLPGAELKLSALRRFQDDLDATHRLTELVFEHDLLEPVVLPPRVVQAYGLPDFLVVRPFPDDTAIFEALPRAYWSRAARFLAAQRISLYAMARLIELAEGAA